MKVCIFGVGAVAGLAGARMARGGVGGLSFVARGAHLDAIRRKGLTVRDRSGGWTVKVHATDDTPSLGVQDVVILGLKAHTIAAALPQITPLIGPDTVVVPTLNGIPWWYFHGLPGDWPKQHLDSVDPGGRIWQALGPERAVGCVVYIGSNIPEPGVIEHNNGGIYVFGEPDGSQSARAARVAGLFEAGGLKSPVAADIRAEVWAKLWGNLTGNPLSVLCDAPCDALVKDAAVAETMAEMMREAAQVAAANGCAAGPDIEGKLDSFIKLGPIKTSMLQDFEAGKTIELDALLGVIGELGRISSIPTPKCDLVYALTRLKATLAGRYVPPHISGSRSPSA
jgi:2-dehydropantoate 2-reductase